MIMKCFSFTLAEGTRNVLGHWTQHGTNNIKRFFDEFASTRKVDPLIANHWYSIGTKDIVQQKDGRTVLQHYNGSLIKALMDVYPDIGLHESKFSNLTKGFWISKSTHRGFFDSIATKMGFDPLVATNWNIVFSSSICKEKRVQSVLNYYNGSILKALIEVYPDVTFLPEYFGDKYWKSASNRKKFMDDLANKMGFDPTVAENWYEVPVVHLVTEKYYKDVLSHYGGSLYNTLVNLYPSLKLREGMFLIDKPTRKRVLEQFSKKHKFDPGNVILWRAFTRDILQADKQLSLVLDSCYEGTITAAVRDLFPTN